MAKSTRPGYLIAIDGADGPAIDAMARTLHDALTAQKASVLISRWDASGLFTECLAAPVEQRDVSPRTLMLLYAADLAFRARWEIESSLAKGHVVIAAPYVASASAFGAATGLSPEWLATVFRFAPEAQRTLVLREPRKGAAWKRRPERGFGDCCTTLLEATPEGFARKKTRAAMVDALETLADDNGGLYRKRDGRALIKELSAAILTAPGRPAAPTRRRRRVR